MNNYDKYTHLMPSHVVAQNEKKARRTAIMFNVLGSVIGGACVYFSIIVWLGQIMPIWICEEEVVDLRNKLVNEIIDDKYATINGKKVGVHDLLEYADIDDLFNITAMLFVNKDDALDHAVDILKQRFDVLFDDIALSAHLINEREEDIAERHYQDVEG